ncbi:MAG: hypothetical protein RR860_03770, partial [Janthinobacterium sp.]
MPTGAARAAAPFRGAGDRPHACASYTSRRAHGAPAAQSGRAHAPRNRLAADLVQFEALIEFLRRDDPRHAGAAVSMERLRERMLLLLPV